MENEKRKGAKPIPDHLDDHLNEVQLLALRRMESFGWHIRFVRRPLFQQVVVVITDAKGEKIGVLDEDGRVNLEPDIEVRP
jgi:hypothetical protein